VTVLRAVCSAGVKAEPPTDFREKQTAIGRAAFKSLARDLPYGLIIFATAILTVFGILIALSDDWALAIISTPVGQRKSFSLDDRIITATPDGIADGDRSNTKNQHR
jgi:hypothetical protein